MHQGSHILELTCGYGQWERECQTCGGMRVPMLLHVNKYAYLVTAVCTLMLIAVRDDTQKISTVMLGMVANTGMFAVSPQAGPLVT